MYKSLMEGIAGLAVAALSLGPLGAFGADDLPDTVVLDRLAQFYESVTFDHASHLDMADSCGACHHHTTGSAPESETCATCHREGQPASTVSCAGCHAAEPFSAVHLAEMERGPQWFHVDKPGLKGAYHRNCLGCHDRQGGPTGCADCHPRNAAGDALFSAAAGRGHPEGGAGHR